MRSGGGSGRGRASIDEGDDDDNSLSKDSGIKVVSCVCNID
jgi:hypothetical protein